MRQIEKNVNFQVVVDAPPSKAHTLRALILSSLADGESRIINPLMGEDQRNVIGCLKALGVEVKSDGNTLTVQGAGGRYTPVSDTLHVGESGVGMNFLSSAICYSNRPMVITGAPSLIRRPVKDVVDGLLQLGCKIEYLEQEGFPPLKVQNTGICGGIAKIYGGKTSQYFSAITIAAACAEKPTVLQCLDDMTEKPYYDITLQMMEKFGVKADNDRYKEISIPGGQTYRPCSINIEGDFSSASFFFLAAAVCNAKVTVNQLHKDSVQGDKAFVDLLGAMGCRITTTEHGICVEGGELRAIEADMSNIPDLVPPMAIAAAFAQGKSRFTNIGHLRHKECDRLAVVVSELNKMGANASCDDTSMTIHGGANLHGAVIDPHNDHRIAMSFAVAGLVTGNQIIENEHCVAKSFPDFWERFAVFEQK